MQPSLKPNERESKFLSSQTLNAWAREIPYSKLRLILQFLKAERTQSLLSLPARHRRRNIFDKILDRHAGMNKINVEGKKCFANEGRYAAFKG
jgi:hypothetical protein